MSRPWTRQWFDDCDAFWCRTLSGQISHWCPDNFSLPVDETVFREFTFMSEQCRCFNCKCGTRMEPKYYHLGRQVMEMHDDIWQCPQFRFWNFWKHTWVNLFFDYTP